VGPIAGLDAVKKREKSLTRAGNQTPAVQPVAIPTELGECEHEIHVLTATVESVHRNR
jgi:hypothetical protein